MNCALGDVASEKQWVAWCNKPRGGTLTKVPYVSRRRQAKSDDPTTWLTHDEAVALAETIVDNTGGGVGIELGRCGNVWLAGVDLDSCRDPGTGLIEPWARSILDRLDTYAEVSPSGTGVKAFFQINPTDIRALRRIMGTCHGRQFKRTNSGAHPPAIELHISHRYFAVTWHALDDWPNELRLMPLDDLGWLLKDAGPAFADKGRSNRGKGGDAAETILARLKRTVGHNKAVATALRNATSMKGGLRSEGALGLGAALRRAGWSYEDMKAALLACPATRNWATEKLAEGNRQFRRIWQKAGGEQARPDDKGSVDDPDTRIPGVRTFLSIEEWAKREVPEPDRLLGDLVTTTTRIFLVGRTGLGKTLLVMGLACGMANGEGFLHWRSGRPARVLVIDGEMPGELIKARSIDALGRAGPIPPGNLVIYSRDAEDEFARLFPKLGRFAPLNSEEGLNFLSALIAALGGVDVVIFDNVMSLLAGDQKDEVSWSEVLPLVRYLTSRRIGQIWMDHTGHNSDRQYGSSTKAWCFDGVGIMTPLPDGQQQKEEVAFKLSFEPPGKARRRTPDNWRDFETCTIRLRDGRWTSEEHAHAPRSAKLSPTANAWHEALFDALVISNTPGRTTRSAWYAEAVRLGLAEPIGPADSSSVKDAKKKKFRKYLRGRLETLG